jgi:hypothetical protein
VATLARPRGSATATGVTATRGSVCFSFLLLSFGLFNRSTSWFVFASERSVLEGAPPGEPVNGTKRGTLLSSLVSREL